MFAVEQLYTHDRPNGLGGWRERLRSRYARVAAALLTSVVLVAGCGDATAKSDHVRPPAPTVAPSPTDITVSEGTGPNYKDGTYFYYAGGSQYVTGGMTGASVRLSQEQPSVVAGGHSLMELALRSADAKNIVEAGWIVGESGGRLTGQARFFVFYWKDGKPTCYNTCGFVPAPGAAIRPGDPVEPGVMATYAIQHEHGGWMVSYNGKDVGLFPDKNWSGAFKEATIVDAFGEVSSSTPTTCTDMGNGKFGDMLGAAAVDGLRLYGTNQPPALQFFASDPAYRVYPFDGVSMAIGGPGAC